ncbi:MAG: HvfC/BufC family peptide modification chaperone [Planctomycetaceae bacterium]
MPRDLATIQRWMQSVITHPDGVAAGIHSPGAREQIDLAPADVETVIGPSQSLTSLQRLHIYANAYHARLLECLREEFPAMVHALGEETFNGFAFGYLQSYPPTSYTLGRLSIHFPKFLEETRPQYGDAGSDAADWPEFLIDLARLERTYADVFDGPGVEGQTLLETDALLAIPQDEWPRVRLVPVECLRLLELRFAVHEYATAVRKGDEPEPPGPRPTWLVVTRRDYVVRREPVSRGQFELLRALAGGETLGDAILRAVEAADADVPSLAADLQSWFRCWTRAGYFRRIT